MVYPTNFLNTRIAQHVEMTNNVTKNENNKLDVNHTIRLPNLSHNIAKVARFPKRTPISWVLCFCCLLCYSSH